jgi:hypothetical protein
MVITLKVAGILRQRYAEWRASLNIFNNPHPKMTL